MKKSTFLQALALVAVIAVVTNLPAFAKGFDQALKILRPTDITTVTDATESGDYCYRYDADELNIAKYDCTDISIGDDLTVGGDLAVTGTATITDTINLSSGLVFNTTLDIDIDAAAAGTVFYNSTSDLIFFCSATGSCGQINGI